MKRGIVFATLVVAMLGASAYGQDQLIASWENTMDHFGTGTNFDGAFFVTDIGVTEGSYALALDFKTGWTQGLRTAYVDGLNPDWDPFFPQLEGATELKLDVTSNRTLFNNPGGAGTIQFALFMQGQPGGGTSFNQTYDYLLITPAYYPEVDYATETLIWDLTLGGTVDPLPHFGPETGGWFDMRMHTNVSTSITDPGIIVIDNLRTNSSEVPVTGLGDFTGDGIVDTADYTTWADNFNEDDTVVFFAGSSNADSVVDTADYTTWADHFNWEYVVDLPSATPPGGTVISTGMTVPEPATMALLGLGVVGLLRRRR